LIYFNKIKTIWDLKQNGIIVKKIKKKKKENEKWKKKLMINEIILYNLCT